MFQTQTSNQIKYVSNFEDLIATSFEGETNAIVWKRKLKGDFSEIVNKLQLTENMAAIEEKELQELPLSVLGQIAREVILKDLEMLKAHGAKPTLNAIKNYERDLNVPFFPTDVYSFHIDKSTIPTDTFLCTYFGEPSEILPNSKAS